MDGFVVAGVVGPNSRSNVSFLGRVKLNGELKLLGLGEVVMVVFCSRGASNTGSNSLFLKLLSDLMNGFSSWFGLEPRLELLGLWLGGENPLWLPRKVFISELIDLIDNLLLSIWDGDLWLLRRSLLSLWVAVEAVEFATSRMFFVPNDVVV